MSRLRIVLDTNVLISAAIKPDGQQALVLNLVAFGAVELYISEAVLAEYREVFSRPKFSGLDLKAVSQLLDLIAQQATLVTPTERLAISPHDSDNRFYECADAAAADYIVTGNLKHFTRPYKNTRIVTGRGLLEMFKKDLR
jgi:putative PIN family toxin of toxin-antitoxin system